MFVKCVGAAGGVICTPRIQTSFQLSNRDLISPRDRATVYYEALAVPSITRSVKRASARARASAIDDSALGPFAHRADPQNERNRNKICPRLLTGCSSSSVSHRLRKRERENEKEKETDRDGQTPRRRGLFATRVGRWCRLLFFPYRLSFRRFLSFYLEVRDKEDDAPTKLDTPNLLFRTCLFTEPRSLNDRV